MKRPISLILLLLISYWGKSQGIDWDQWDPENLHRANTAANFTSYTEDEKKVVFFMNLARINGELFASTILDKYVEVNNVNNNSYLRSLYRDLKNTAGLKPLIPVEDLTATALKHAVESGKSGYVGHKNFSKRFSSLIGDPYSNIGENCSYGHKDAIDIVITLLIDDGIKGVGHRENTLNPDFNSVGLAIREHKNYRYNCVIDFGWIDKSNLNEVPGFSN